MTTKKCNIEKCEKKVLARGMCSAHYTRFKKYGNPNILLRNENGEGSRFRNGNIFLYKPGHPNSAKNGKILEHYYVMSGHLGRKIEKYEYIEHLDGDRSNNNINNLKISTKPTYCLVDKCENKISRKNLCPKHYRRQLKYGDVNFTLIPRSETGKCTIDECDRPHEAKGFCAKHYLRFKNYGTPILPIKNRKPIITECGYRLIYSPEHENSNTHGYVPEHRLVMSNYISRPLLDHENVHHKNGNRLDNNLTNLELWSVNQPSGQRIQDKVQWAKEIIKLYGDLVEKISFE